MVEGIGGAIEALYRFMVVWLIISVPLTLWKVVDILIWIYNHVSLEIK